MGQPGLPLDEDQTLHLPVRSVDGKRRARNRQPEPDLGGSSYAGNAQVFCRADSSFNITFVGGVNQPLGSRCSDGTSHTILVAEKYARCVNNHGYYTEGGSFWAYAQTGGGIPYHPAFAVWWHPTSVGEYSKFQYKPRWDDCDPTLASTGHTGGMQVCLADGSVRPLRHDISGTTWWALCTPEGGEVVGPLD